MIEIISHELAASRSLSSVSTVWKLGLCILLFSTLPFYTNSRSLSESKTKFGAHEAEVNVPASEAWKLYGTLQLGKFMVEYLPNVLIKMNVLQGNGTAGTVVEKFYPSGTQDGIKTFKENFTVVDDEKHVKVTEVVEGGLLDFGFTLYRLRIEIMEKEGVTNQCTTKGTIEYEVKDEFAENASLFSMEPLTATINCGNAYLQAAANNASFVC